MTKPAIRLVSVKKTPFSRRENFSLFERSEFEKLVEKRKFLAGGSLAGSLVLPLLSKVTKEQLTTNRNSFIVIGSYSPKRVRERKIAPC
jgi:hypothetical protein